MNHAEKLSVLQFLRPDAEFLLIDDEIQWLDDKQTQPTENEIANGWTAYQEKCANDLQLLEDKKNATVAKLESLGLDVEDLKVLGLG